MAGATHDPQIRTARLVLRRPRVDDAPRVAALVGDFGVARNLARVPHPYGLEDAQAFLGALDTPGVRDRPSWSSSQARG